MPDVSTHLQQATHNEAFFSGINLDVYGDWAVTVLFYTALHYIDAYLATVGQLDPGSHDVRDSLIGRYAPTRQVWREYRRLKSFSRSARYYGSRFSPGDVRGLHLTALTAIKTRMLPLLR